MTYGARPIGTRGYGDNSGYTAAVSGYTPVNVSIDLPSIASGEAVFGPTVTSTYPILVDAIGSGAAVYAPNIFEPLVIRVGHVPSATGTIIGPRILQTGGTPSSVFTPRIRAYTVDKNTMYGTELANSFGRQWQDVRNDTGTGSMALHNTDASLSTVTYGSIVRFHLEDNAVFSIIVESIERQTVAPNEEVDEITVFSGRGLLSVWEDMIAEPALGPNRVAFSDTRLFNFASPDLDDSGWANAVVSLLTHQESDGTPIVPPRERDYPMAWPDTSAVNPARWIWDRYAGYNNVPQGDVYFRTSFVVASTTAAEVWAACDDQFELWLNGEALFEDKEFPGYVGQAKKQSVRLDAGTHYIAVRGINNNNLQAGLLVSVIAFDTDGYATTALLKSDATWKVLAYPSEPPGFTPGEIIRILLDEARDRLPATTPSPAWSTNHLVLQFDDNVDSSGTPWPTTSDVAVQVGTDLLSILRQLCETYIDIRVPPGFLGLYAYSTYDHTTSAVLEAEVNITELRHAGEF